MRFLRSIRLAAAAALLVSLGPGAAASPPGKPEAHRRPHERILQTVDAVKRQLERRFHADRLAEAAPGAELAPAPSPDSEPPEPAAPTPGP